MFIQDPIHGYIQLNELEADLISLPEFQRLRRIKQLGFANLVYPSTTHTRFEHSLGACYLAGRFSDHLDLPEDDHNHLRAAALLHDLGHGPHSHTSEQILKKHNQSHEDFSCAKIQSDEISSVLEQHNIDPERVIDLVNGMTELGQIIAGDIDVDRMDYLMRDAHYSGVAHGTIDAETILRSATMHDGKLVFRSKFKQALEGLLVARYLMIPTLYNHRAVQRAEKMMERAMEELVISGEIEAEDLPSMDDIDLKSVLRTTNNQRAHYLNKRLDNRNVFKTAVSWGENDIGREGLKEIARNLPNEREVEQKIAEQAGVDVKHVLIDPPYIPKPREIDVKMLHRGSVRSLDAMSPLADATRHSEWEQVALHVYCPDKHMDAIGDASQTVLKEYKNLLSKYL
jgi:HD superfamily phosphohydrolase